MAAPSMFSTFNASNVSFSDVRKNPKGGKAVYLNQVGGGKLMFQLPPLRAPFGLSEYKDETTGRVSYTLPLSLDNPEILAQFSALDDKILSYITDHSEEILGKKMSRDVISEGLYKSPIKKSSKEGYAPTLSLKVVTSIKDGSIVTEAYGSDRQIRALSDLEKGQSLRAIIDINQIWRTPAGVGVSIRVHQVMFMATNKLKPCAFVVPVEEAEAETEYETDPDAE